MVTGELSDSPAPLWQSENNPGNIRITEQSPGISDGEGIHPGNSIEWWFIQGSFQGPTVTTRHFMASIFRYDISQNKSASDDGYYVILSLLNPATGENSVISRGERRIIEQVSVQRDDAQSTNLDRDLVKTYIEEIRAYGPPAPVTLDDSPLLITRDPFSFSWNDINLRVMDDAIFLSFGNAGSNGQCRFNLTPLSERYCMENVGFSPSDSMTYVSRPRLSLSGYMGDEPVTGTAWFDHQWGNTGWFLSKPGDGTLHGWDWIGINGSDGTDWIFLTFHDPEIGNVLGMSAFMFREGQPVRVFREFTVTPSRFWTSQKTHIRYPVAMDITVPEISAGIRIEAVTDNQEIPVLGFMRAVWEGAATASGFVGTVPFTGTARLELHGYGYIFDFQHYIADHVSRIRENIDAFIPENMSEEGYRKFVDVPGGIHDIAALNETILKPSRDLLSREKKYWRPLFSLLLLETLGVSSEKYQQLLSVVPELTHTGTLIIDDIEDNAEVRRGDTSIHRRYGTDVAINAANTLYFLSSVLYSTHPDLTDSQRLDFYRITFEYFIRGHFGQAQDIFRTKNLQEEVLVSETRDQLCEKILQMYEFKTASAAMAMAEGGCILAGSGADVRKACVAFARAFGVAFQITDDIQSFELSRGTGMTMGDDLSAGKLTYVIARALALLDERDRARLLKILCSASLRNNADCLFEGVELIRKSGSLLVCRAESLAIVDDAWRSFSAVIPQSEQKIMLRLFTRNLVADNGNS